jgi:hypothetical protein
MSETQSDQGIFSKPFQIFVGEWNGGVTIFNREGQNVAYWPGTVHIHWIDANTLHYEQYLDQLANEFGKDAQKGPLDPAKVRAFLEKDKGQKISVQLHIDGKRAVGSTGDGHYLVQAQESAPGNYLFMIRDIIDGFIYCNNHFFVTPNLRQITGPTLASEGPPAPGSACPHLPGLVQAVNIQTFTRVSYTATDEPVTKAAPASRDGWQRALFLRAWVDDGFKKLLSSDRKGALHLLAKERGIAPSDPAHAPHIEDLIKDTHDCPPPACC